MIPLVPYQRYTFSTSLELTEAANVVSSAVATYKWWGIFTDRDDPEFVGQVRERGFWIHKAIHYRNSFLPVMYGTFTPTPQGTRVDLVVTLDKFVWVFCALWCTGAAAIFVRGLIEAITMGYWNWYVFLPLAAIVLLWLVQMISFGFYAQPTVDFVTGLFERHTGDRWHFWA